MVRRCHLAHRTGERTLCAGSPTVILSLVPKPTPSQTASTLPSTTPPPPMDTSLLEDAEITMTVILEIGTHNFDSIEYDGGLPMVICYLDDDPKTTCIAKIYDGVDYPRWVRMTLVDYYEGAKTMEARISRAYLRWVNLRTVLSFIRTTGFQMIPSKLSASPPPPPWEAGAAYLAALAYRSEETCKRETCFSGWLPEGWVESQDLAARWLLDTFGDESEKYMLLPAEILR
ncbi:hypothetical protein QBC36DRAFT_354326 [Triangularia setosa]|uniref:Uncharacterized protein n=1 Tax=Triangularia setosa TaxID=2587417 RepID=A0AAN6W749_9PEZI|nr:hypothetical protein QBC36DRAFT_354326 [Podospora setosa]